eukprot:2070583-Pleurochrysis_carterae.AAC.1
MWMRDIYGWVLANTVKTVLAQPVSASLAKRNWSVYGLIKSKSRNRLGQRTSNKLVYEHEALHLKDMLQCASAATSKQSAAK